jgi:hypothetical protein
MNKVYLLYQTEKGGYHPSVKSVYLHKEDAEQAKKDLENDEENLYKVFCQFYVVEKECLVNYYGKEA